MTDTKIFFFDLDGTLLNSEKTVSPKTKEALRAFCAAGHRVAISSGRSVDSVAAVYRENLSDLPDVLLVCSNGAHVADAESGRDIFRIPIPFPLVKTVFEIAADCGIHCQTYSDTHIITPSENENLTYYRRYIKTPVCLTDDIVSALDREPCKCLAIELHDADRLEAFRKEVKKKAGDRLTLVYSNPYYLEIFSAEAGKGNAVLRLCEHLSIPVENALAAGDAENDVPMLLAAGKGIAMKNGSDTAKTAADVVTEEDNDHDGLVPYLVP